MTKKNKKLEYLILIIALVILCYFIFRNTGFTINSKKIRNYTPYEKEVEIHPDFSSCNEFTDGKTAIDYFKKNEFVKFRVDRVKKYSYLNVFPDDYNPFKGLGTRIYGRITFGKKWLGPTVFYIANPYCLIAITKANHVTPAILACKNTKITYKGRFIKEVYKGRSAYCWFEFINFYNEYGHLRVILVNAYDAGFYYAHLDKSKSVNIEKGDYEPNIVTSVFSQSSFYHVGRYGVNNISPKDKRGWFKIKKKNTYTKIFIKLWRKLPSLVENDGDMNYIIEVIPDNKNKILWNYEMEKY